MAAKRKKSVVKKKKAAKRKPGPKKGTGGRPNATIDWEVVDSLCALHCTAEEIASVVDCHVATLNNRCKVLHKVTFSVYIQQKRGPGNVSLRRRLWTLAEGGNVATAIFLAKKADDDPSLFGLNVADELGRLAIARQECAFGDADGLDDRAIET